jgi:hypothetical protein
MVTQYCFPTFTPLFFNPRYRIGDTVVFPSLHRFEHFNDFRSGLRRGMQQCFDFLICQRGFIINWSRLFNRYLLHRHAENHQGHERLIARSRQQMRQAESPPSSHLKLTCLHIRQSKQGMRAASPVRR